MKVKKFSIKHGQNVSSTCTLRHFVVVLVTPLTPNITLYNVLIIAVNLFITIYITISLIITTTTLTFFTSQPIYILTSCSLTHNLYPQLFSPPLQQCTLCCLPSTSQPPNITCLYYFFICNPFSFTTTITTTTTTITNTTTTITTASHPHFPPPHFYIHLSTSEKKCRFF